MVSWSGVRVPAWLRRQEQGLVSSGGNYHDWDDGITVTLMIDGMPISEASIRIK